MGRIREDQVEEKIEPPRIVPIWVYSESNIACLEFTFRRSVYHLQCEGAVIFVIVKDSEIIIDTGRYDIITLSNCDSEMGIIVLIIVKGVKRDGSSNQSRIIRHEKPPWPILVV